MNEQPSNLDAIKAAIAGFATTGQTEYMANRADLAKRLKVPTKFLDTQYAEARKARGKSFIRNDDASGDDSPKWAPPKSTWAEPVDGAKLLAELTEAIHRFVMVDGQGGMVVALWVLFSWLFEAIAEISPFLRIVSATSGCGKSTLLKVLRRLVRAGWIVSRITSSAFARTMNTERRTLLLDEGDAFLSENEVMRNVLDGASDIDTSTIALSIKSGDEWVPTELNVFVPIVIASIGTLRRMQTIEDRSIPIHLKRATPAELKRLAKGRRRELDAVLGPIAEKCARWAADNAEKLKGARPELPDGLSGREMDKWEGLIAIADLIGEEAGKAARLAATEVSGAHDADMSIGVLLINDIRRLFDTKNLDKVSSQTLSEELALLEDRPWAEYGEPKPISKNQVARLLRPFEVKPHTVRLSEDLTLKGYERDDFRDAFERYPADPKNVDSPILGTPDRNTVTTQRAVGRNGDFQTATGNPCGGLKNGTFPYGEKGCDGVTVETPLYEGDGALSGASDDLIEALVDDDWEEF